MIITPRPQANVLLARQRVTRIDARDLRAELDRAREALRLFDVRSPSDYARGHVRGAKRLAVRRRTRARRLRRDCANVLYGADARDDAPYLAAWELVDAGLPVVVLEGGYAAWRKECGDGPPPDLPALFAVLRVPEGACA